jgi:hypothetical protein
MANKFWDTPLAFSRTRVLTPSLADFLLILTNLEVGGCLMNFRQRENLIFKRNRGKGLVRIQERVLRRVQQEYLSQLKGSYVFRSDGFEASQRLNPHILNDALKLSLSLKDPADLEHSLHQILNYLNEAFLRLLKEEFAK